jgi:hypothetical protein
VIIGYAQWPCLEPHVSLVVAAINRAIAGSYEVVDIPAYYAKRRRTSKRC